MGNFLCINYSLFLSGIKRCRILRATTVRYKDQASS